MYENVLIKKIMFLFYKASLGPPGDTHCSRACRGNSEVVKLWQSEWEQDFQ